MSAALMSIAQDAAVKDWPIDPTLGEGMELRAGSNGWVCRPDDPRCLDANWRMLFGMEFGPEREALNMIGFAYILQGDSVPDNNDPSLLQPLVGQEWQTEPPHFMLVAPWDLDPAMYPTDPQAGGPYIMFAGTPIEHLMVPVTEMRH